jgi:cold shock protein
VRMMGRVKWFSNEKGYGFIDMGDDDEDVFVHYTAILGDGYRTLRQGERVQFDLYDGERGPQARNVIRLDADQDEPEGLLETA